MIKKIKNWFGKHWQILVIILLSACFFVAVSSYNFYTQKDDFVKWTSPDETANYVFAKLYGQTGELAIFEKYNLWAEDVIHPRSFRSDNGLLKPMSFLGIILIYGRIAALTSHKILPFLTPFFASLGIIFFYLLIKRLFGKTNAFISALLLISFPVWIYYSARSMFHNVLFVSLLIIGLYFSILIGGGKRCKLKFFSLKIWKMNWLGFLFSALAGFFVGLAVITRTSELLWILPMFLILWIFNLKKVGLLKLLIFLSFTFLAVVPALSWNQILYGGFFRGGYTEMNQSIVTIASASSDLVKSTIQGQFNYIKELISRIKDSVFYFGFKPVESEKMFYYYFVQMFAYLFWPALLGFFLFVQRIKKWKKKHWVFILSFLTFSAILIFYYGSWEFYDNPDKAAHTIGNSYTRYWLPIYLASFPLVAFFIKKFSETLFSREANGKEVKVRVLSKKKWAFFRIRKPEQKFLTISLEAIIIIIIFFVSVSFVSIGSKEGLVYSAGNHFSARSQYEQIMAQTESDSVIITSYHDKLLFPERKVIVGLLTDDNMNNIYASLTGLLPVYYYNFTFPQKDFDYLNESKLKKSGLSIEEVKKIDNSFSLYRIKKN